MFKDQQEKPLNALDASHDAYYRSETFGGPSLHFHLRSIAGARAQDFEGFTNDVYAVLPSWGMHRMGPGGSKMREFEEFRASMQAIWPRAMGLQGKTPDSLTSSDWSDLKEIFCGIRCMASGTSLVGNSKVMAHLLPQLVPLADRKYTLTFLFRNSQIANNLENEWTTLARILGGFFYPILRSSGFRAKADTWLREREKFKWDTSDLKIVDNLVIGFSKIVPAASGFPKADVVISSEPTVEWRRAI